ncbi:TRAP transporter substrate-binding protein DctP [Desertibacillus haloalkaliphilus]|uniref:TRAP transporter substrate-binding protein DctP n=1 Tax=Desertibacillus haloalkaliphilus TaxID=1328930 RepID=UPI001C270FE8|nr:TRAP transporter substrate-binding protein DctP [Desertibacillus haloalkaliphilus]MBU8907922.1 TRAP transporter substrate-binding protein DctP [Desertibacillus haloalkaliphilus]
MKSFFVIFCLFIISIVTTACVQDGSNNNGSQSSENSEDTITLRVSSSLSPQNGWWAGFFIPWMESVEEKSEGKVQFDYFTAEELLSVGEELQGMREGTIDIAAPLWTVYDPQRFPLSEVTMLPLTDSDPMMASLAYSELVQSELELVDGKTYADYEFVEKGIKALPIPTTEQYVISTKDYEFNTIEDFEKVSLRSPSRVHEVFANEVGINTVTLPSTELFDSVNRGAMEGSFFSISDWTGYGMQDVFNYTLEGINLGHYSGVWAMSEDKWNSLPKEIQDIMIEAAIEQIPGGAQLWMDRSIENKENSIEDGGVFATTADLEPEAEEMVLQGMENTWYEWIEMTESNGHPGTQIAKLWRDLIVEQGGTVPESIMNLE